MPMNQETINDRFKLAYHRVAARALRICPGLIDEAREVVEDWIRASGPQRPTYVDEWREILAQPTDAVRREIIRRTQRMTRLRISSPFPLMRTRLLSQDQRLALYSKNLRVDPDRRHALQSRMSF